MKINYLAGEAEKEKKDEQGRAINAAMSWLPKGATLGGIIGVIMGFKSCSNGGEWNSFLSEEFYGVIIGCIIGGIAKAGQFDQAKPVLLTRLNRFRLTTLSRNILSLETMLILILAIL